MVHCAWQVLEILHKELLWVFSILRQWLHHAKHLAHIWLKLLENALHLIPMKLTTRFIKLTWSGQGSKLDYVLSFGFMMYISSHPLKDPCLRIPIVATNVKSGIELQQKLFIPVLLVRDKWQKTNFPETVKGFFKTGQPSNSFTIKAHVLKDSPLIV